jgi:hypothetical protein
MRDWVENSLPKPLIGFIFDKLGLMSSPESMNPTCMILETIAVRNRASNNGKMVRRNKLIILLENCKKSGMDRSLTVKNENPSVMTMPIW